MARTSFGFASLPVLCFTVACATAVDQGFNDDGDADATGGSQSGSQGGSSSLAGQAATSAGQTTGNAGQTTGNAGGTDPGSGSGGKPVAAFGGTNGGGGATSAAGASSGGQSAGAGGKAGNSIGGTSAGAAGKGGAGGTSAGAGGSTAGSSSGGSSSGSGGSGGSTSSTGDCAAANTGWVVQYWTGTGAANMPAGDVRIFNNAGGSVNFNTLELRHYFSNEETATLSFIFSTFGHNLPASPYYEDEGGANVLSSIKNVTPAVANASQYISVKFNATPGTFGNGEYVQLGFYGSLSMYPLKSNQANDYTYLGHPTTDPGSANKTLGWDHITLYAGGELVWGCEP